MSTVAPSSGPLAGGNSVIITGTNFLGATAVSFGANAATTFNVDSDTQITATSPAGSAGPVDVTVITAGGTSATSNADTYTYAAAPTVSSVAPSSGPLAGGNSVIITGTNFTGATAVSFGANAATTFNVDSDTQITATSPAGSAGPVDVTLITAGGTSATSNADTYTYAAVPTVSSVSPNAGPLAGGTSVTIAGTNFTATSTVSFGGNAATGFTFVDSTKITASSPAGTGVVDVTVTTAGGTSGTGAPADQFTYTAGPTVSSVSPNAGPLAGGTSVTIAGTNFTAASTVSFGGNAATGFTFVNSTKITASSPAGSGVVDVTVTTVGGTSGTGAPADQFTYTAGPTVTSVTPNAGPLAGGTSVTITGTNFTNASTVSFGGNAATGFTFVNSTKITASSPAGTGVVDVTVTTAGGTSGTGAPADQFTYTPGPTVSSVNPNAGPLAGGTTVTIGGTNFTNPSTVSFGGNAATGVTFVSATQITASSPAGTGVVDVTVTTAGGTSGTGAPADQFTYTPGPTVSSVTPNAGPLAGGTTVTIGGTNFTNPSTVSFGGNAATGFTFVNSTKITASSPAGSAGPVNVTVTTVGGTSAISGADSFTYVAAPTVSSVSPNAGPTVAGTSVTITGTNFTSASAVKFGANAATGVTVLSATQVTAVSPAGAVGQIDVTVTTVGGTSSISSADRFTYVAAPTISSVSPISGPAAGATSVTIAGTNFTGATTVKFGATTATFTTNNPSQITATSPAGAPGPVNVTVTTVGGTSAISSGDTFTYVAAPTVTAVAPNAGPLVGTTSVIITGTNFTAASAVHFGTTTATFTVNNANQITATSPAGVAGPVNVTVTTIGGTSAISSADTFTYVALPTVTSLLPIAGPATGATSVVITGTNLTGATAVKFGATAATTFSVNSATQITATSPAGVAGQVDVTVTTVGGTSTISSADRFTYVAAPTVSSVSPNTGPATGATSVIITGANFTGATAVHFGVATATFTVNSATQITAKSPAGAPGPVNVTVTTVGGTSAITSGDTFTYVAAPTVSSVAPNAGPTTGATSVTITGANFTGATSVKFGTVAATTFTVNSATQITATSPGGAAGLVNVTVTTLGGTSAISTGATFTYVTPPTVGSVVPSKGGATGLDTVTINGSNLAGATSVYFGTGLAGIQPGQTSSTQLIVKSPGGSGTADVTVTTPGGTSTLKAAFTYTTKCLNALLTASPSSATPGALVTFTAGPPPLGTMGCPNPIFEFWLGYPNGTWHLLQSWSSSAAWTWNTRGYASGTYGVRLGANESGDSLTSFEARASIAYALSGCSTATVNASPASSQSVGAVVTVTAGSSGCSSPIYEFWLQYPGGGWFVGRAFSSSATWSWNTAGYPSGAYNIHVWANQSGHSTASYEALAAMPYSLVGGAATCVTASLSPSNPSSPAGANVSLTATSTGCPSPQYEFWVQYLNKTWYLKQGWGGPSFNWSTAGLAPGSYTVHVWANQAPKSTFEAFGSDNVTLTLTGCTSAALSPASGSSAVGTSVTFTARSTGCTPIYEFWLEYPDATWHLMQGFGSGNKWTWATTGRAKGNYVIHVWANHQGGNTSTYEVFGSATYTLK